MFRQGWWVGDEECELWEMRTQTLGSMVISWEEVSGSICMEGPKDPESISYHPALAWQPAISFSANVRDTAPIRPVLYPMICPIGNGLFQPVM